MAEIKTGFPHFQQLLSTAFHFILFVICRLRDFHLIFIRNAKMFTKAKADRGSADYKHRLKFDIELDQQQLDETVY